MKTRPTLTLKSNNNRVNGSVEVLQITDLHLLPESGQSLLGVNTEETARQVIGLAKSQRWPPDLILLTGDLTQEPLSGTYRRLDRMLGDLDNVPCVCLPGNHDDPALMDLELRSDNVYFMNPILTEFWQIICLDSSEPQSPSGHFTQETLNALEGHLERHPDKFALICLHHHPIPIGCAWLDTMVLDETKRFFEILESHPRSRAVICGHIHQSLEITHRNIRVMGTPSTCFQFKPGCEAFALDETAPGYRRLSLGRDGSVATEVYRLPELPKGINLSSSGY